ncbi:MAG: hypothetical protein U9R50_08165, partial [Campylobacterota bacterium]|nr:hypothetical protein [Campylobacterota bacterium]
MKIEHSNISLLSSYHKHQEIQEQETLHTWNTQDDAPERLQRGDRLELSDEFNTLKNTPQIYSNEEASLEVPLDPKLMSIVRALEALTGQKIDLSFLTQGKTPHIEKLQANTETQETLGWGIEYNYERTETHHEKLQFSAEGQVKTQKGEEIDFELAFSMQKSSLSHESIIFKAGDALIDPLVLNFGADTVSMSNIKHRFDLNLDGQTDEFSFVGQGSGFLALDKNNDRHINDGSELFGPTLGNGFEELRAYDSDHNNWIDENDAIFEKLLIWTKDEEGTEQLMHLKEIGVGALYLESIETAFELDGKEGSLLAKMRESSIYLTENGRVGTLQEIDL